MILSSLLRTLDRILNIPVDANGNITTTRSVNVKTLQDVITTDGKDVLPSMLGGMVRIPKDPGDGKGVELGAAAAAPGG